MEPDTFRGLKPGRTSKRTGGGEETLEEMLFPSLSTSQEVTDTISSARHAHVLRPRSGPATAHHWASLASLGSYLLLWQPPPSR